MTRNRLSTKRLRVAMVSSERERCGIATYSQALVKALVGISEFETRVEVIETGLPMAQYREQAALANLADVVHIQHEYGLWDGYWQRHYLKEFIRAIRRPLVLTLHTTAPRIWEARKLTAKRVAAAVLTCSQRFSDYTDIVPLVEGKHCIVHTAAGKRQLVERGAQPDLIHVKSHPAPPPLEPARDGSAFRRKFQLEGRRILSIFGFITRRKQYELALSVLRSLPSDVVLVIAGGPNTTDGELYERELRGAIAAGGLERRVVITGFLSDGEIAEVMAATQVVAVPETYLHGASGSAMVALSYGKAVVASDLDCFREMQEKVPCLRMFPPGDGVELQKALASLFEDPTELARMGQLALEYANMNSFATFARENIHVYEAALALG